VIAFGASLLAGVVTLAICGGCGFFLAGALSGGAAGAAHYSTYTAIAPDDFTWQGFTAATATGAAVGAIGGGITAGARRLLAGNPTPTASAAAKQPRASETSTGATAAPGSSASVTNKIYSSRVLTRMVDEPGPYHNFPGSFDDRIFSQGSREVNPNYFTKSKGNLGSDSIQYRLPGQVNGRSGVYEIFTRPSASGRTELVMHRFFRPEY
jgi:hypothetical protein